MEKKLRGILKKAIPLTKAMGVTIDKHDDRQLSIHAPFASKFNHPGTAFSGSLNIALCPPAVGRFSCDCVRKG